MGRLGGVDDLDDLELDLAGKDVEEPPSASEQHGDLTDLQLVEHPLGQRLLGGVAALHVHVLGAILNDVDVKSRRFGSAYYEYYRRYGAYYGEPDEAKAG